MFAAVGGECEAVKDLISEGVDVNAQNNVRKFWSYQKGFFMQLFASKASQPCRLNA